MPKSQTSGWRLAKQTTAARPADQWTKTKPELWRALPKRLSEKRYAPENYRASPGLLDAIDTAISVGQPLVLTGEPGVGKTTFAEYVAWRLELPELKPDRRVLRFDVKSNLQGRDLLYRYDALDHFNAAHIRKEEVEAREFVTFEALGEAILRTLSPKDVEDLLGRPLTNHSEPIRSVVLIDEIDKAPRDLPNDLLREIEDMAFMVPELGRRAEIEGDREFRPIVIITSNRETRLPDAFMRRCCFYYIPFPKKDGDLQEIITQRLDDLPADADLVQDAITLLREVRKLVEGRGRPPGIAELLAFLEDLKSRDYQVSDRLAASPQSDWRRSAATIFLEGDQDDDERISDAVKAMQGSGTSD